MSPEAKQLVAKYISEPGWFADSKTWRLVVDEDSFYFTYSDSVYKFKRAYINDEYPTCALCGGRTEIFVYSATRQSVCTVCNFDVFIMYYNSYGYSYGHRDIAIVSIYDTTLPYLLGCSAE